MLRSKIHRATVTENRLDYEGSITIDSELIKLSGLYAGEKVLIADVTNGNRLETYVIPGEGGSGIIAMNGAAARLCDVGDLIIIMGFELTDREIETSIVFVDDKNRPVERYSEPHRRFRFFNECHQQNVVKTGGENGSRMSASHQSSIDRGRCICGHMSVGDKE